MSGERHVLASPAIATEQASLYIKLYNRMQAKCDTCRRQLIIIVFPPSVQLHNQLDADRLFSVVAFFPSASLSFRRSSFTDSKFAK